MSGVAAGAFGRRWFVAKSLPRKEALAELHLKRQAFETFLPLLRAPARATRHGPESRLIPFFPGYLFIRLHVRNDRWRSVNGTIGVSSLLQNGGAPAPVPEGLVEELQSRTKETGELGFEDALATGDSVRIVGGPFDRLIGIFQELDGTGRARVLLEIMGRPVSVVLDRASVMTV